MNIAVALGTLMLTGWVLPTPTQPVDQPVVPFGGQAGELPLPGVQAQPSRARGMGSTEMAAPYRSQLYRQSRGQQDTYREPYVPTMPTDPSLGGADSPWAPPTESDASTVPGFGARPSLGPRQSAGGYYRRAPTGGAYRGRAPQRTTPSRSASELAAAQLQAARLEAATRSNSALQSTKPFAGYSPPPGVSPYLNLFRRDYGIDPYYTYVRPQLEAQQASQIIGGQIRGLQSATRLQSAVLQRLGKRPETMGGTMVPEFFMNHQQFYPAFR